MVPDLHDTDEKGAQHKLQEAGLKWNKIDKCSGTDQGDQKVKKGHVVCQNPPAGQPVSPGTTVDYVVVKK
jgi:beta-lactam-binding protein with PASTA domain